MESSELILPVIAAGRAFQKAGGKSNPKTYPLYAQREQTTIAWLFPLFLYLFAGLRVNKRDFQTKPQSISDFL